MTLAIQAGDHATPAILNIAGSIERQQCRAYLLQLLVCINIASLKFQYVT